MTIDELTMANKVHREIIEKLKRFINECDHTIKMNEIEIGRHLGAMQHEDCTLCLGECDGNV